MTPIEARRVAAMSPQWKRFIRLYYELPPRVNLVHALLTRGIGHIDLCLMLARRPSACRVLGVLIGKTVALGPRVMLTRRYNTVLPTVKRSKCWRDRPISHVDPKISIRYVNRPEYGDVVLHVCETKPNCTPRDIHARGVPWRSLDRFHNEGALRVR